MQTPWRAGDPCRLLRAGTGRGRWRDSDRDPGDAPDRVQRSRRNLKDRDRGHHQRYHPGERTLGEMSFQPFKIAAPIYDLVDARLQKEDGEERRDKDLEKKNCSAGRMQGWHRVIQSDSRSFLRQV